MGLENLVKGMVNISALNFSYPDDCGRGVAYSLDSIKELIESYKIGDIQENIEQIVTLIRKYKYNKATKEELTSVGETNIEGNQESAKWVAESLFKYQIVFYHLENNHDNILKKWEKIEEQAQDILKDDSFELVAYGDIPGYLEKLTNALEISCLSKPEKWVKFFNNVVELSGIQNPDKYLLKEPNDTSISYLNQVGLALPLQPVTK